MQPGMITADSCASSLKACDSDDFPNLYILFKIAATLPVTSCGCERSISTMRILNNCMRCTMGESRLSSLAIMHFRYEQSAPRGPGGLSFCSEIPCSTYEFCKTFRVSTRYVSLCMNVPSQTEILLL